MLVGIVLPMLAWQSHRWMARSQESGELLPSTRTLALQAMGLQVILLLMALLAMYASNLSVEGLGTWSWQAMLLAIGTLTIALVLAEWEARRPLPGGDAFRRQLRRSRAGSPYWIASAISAAVVEEFCYRGVLTSSLAGAIGYWPAVASSALLFGLAHLGQGWRGAVFSTIFAIGMQLLCLVQQGLLAAILVHFSYDMIVSARGNRLVATRGNALS